MKTEEPIETLAADPHNPRRISPEALTGLGVSMRTFGDLSTVVWNKRSGRLVGGHQRLEQLRRAGVRTWSHNGQGGEIVHPETGERFPVRIVDWDETTERLANLAANNPALQGEFTPEALAQVRALDDDVNYAALRLDALQATLEAALPPAAAEDGKTDADAVPEPPKTPTTKLGDLWLLGDHRLLCGDSTDAEHVARLMEGQKAVLMATDPPYGVDFAGAKYNPRAKAWDGIANDKLQGAGLKAFLLAFLKAWLPSIDDTAGFYFWTAAMEECAAAAAAVREAGLHIQSQIIWQKNSLVLGQADYQWKHENCWYAFWKGKKHRWYGGRDKTTVWSADKVAHSEYLHPMQKPVGLYEVPQQHHTKAGEIVAEPFSGSGTQIIAAERLKRRCFAMEVEPGFVDVAVARWEAFTGKKAIRERAKPAPAKHGRPTKRRK